MHHTALNISVRQRFNSAEPKYYVEVTLFNQSITGIHAVAAGTARGLNFHWLVFSSSEALHRSYPPTSYRSKGYLKLSRCANPVFPVREGDAPVGAHMKLKNTIPAEEGSIRPR
jgi:hypothetical protein